MSAFTNNGVSRQRVVRIVIEHDNWLLKRAKAAKKKNPDARAGVATEINALIKKAYEADTGKTTA